MKCEKKLTSPKKLLISVAFVGVFAFLTASTLDLSGYIPLSVKQYPANVSFVVPNTHFFGLIFKFLASNALNSVSRDRAETMHACALKARKSNDGRKQVTPSKV